MARRTKYNNRKSLYQGHWFDSNKEIERYNQLLLMERACMIRCLKPHPKPGIPLLAPYIHKDGRKIRGITYEPDFRYVDCETGETIYEDVKGVETQVFKDKRKWLEWLYPDLILRVVETAEI